MSTFESLAIALRGHFHKSFAQLPPDIQQRVQVDFAPWPWDSKTSRERCHRAKQWDHENDPARREIREGIEALTNPDSLPQFASWALSMGWELPDKFPRFKSAPPQPATAKTAPATQNPLYVAIQHIVKSELQKHYPAPVVSTKPQARSVVTESAPDGMKPAKVGPVSEKPWLVIDPSDPKAIQPWYTPARYFARQLVMKDSTLLQKRSVLADKVSKSLADTGFKKRGGNPWGVASLTTDDVEVSHAEH